MVRIHSGVPDSKRLSSRHQKGEYTTGHLPYEGIYAAALFGGLMIRMGTITGARGGEIQQIAQSPDSFKQLLLDDYPPMADN